MKYLLASLVAVGLIGGLSIVNADSKHHESAEDPEPIQLMDDDGDKKTQPDQGDRPNKSDNETGKKGLDSSTCGGSRHVVPAGEGNNCWS